MSDLYFGGYEDLDVHRVLLEDEPRLSAYRDAISRSKSRIRGKIVLDVGSGTGILSLFCAQMGAKRVHAVEATRVADLSRQIIKDNGMEKVVEVHNCLVEELTLSEKVDVIVSEWMGFYLFHEGMLESVICARDKFLKPDGLIIPESADLWVAPCELPQFFDRWDDVCGVGMQSMAKFYRATKKKPLVVGVGASDIIADGSVVKSVFLNSATVEELENFFFRTLVCAGRDGKYQGLCLWFVCNFVTDDNEVVFLSTHPEEPATHWKQTAIVFPFEIPVDKGDPIAFSLEFRKNGADSRKYDIEMTMLDPEKEEHPVPCCCNSAKCRVIHKYMEQTMSSG